MRKYPFRILRHAILMVGRTLKSYVLLSVTIILSFSLLLGYLVWIDSSIYNSYKDIFSKDRNVVVVYDQLLKNVSFSQLLKEKAADHGCLSILSFENAIFGSIHSKNSMLQLENGKTLEPIETCAISVPPHAWCLYSVGGTELYVTWIDGNDHNDFHLKSGEVLVDERLYTIFSIKEKNNKFSLSLSGYHDSAGNLVNQPFAGDFTVVGIIHSNEPLEIKERESPSNSVYLCCETAPSIAFSSVDFNCAAFPQMNWYSPTAVFYSPAPEQVDALLRSAGITANIDAVYIKQDNALEIIQNKVKLKMVITIALLVILGINLYSCFLNALNDRKFEVGVRRALGASKWSIVRQFLYESLLVMITNIIIAVWLVLTAAIIYKVIIECTSNEVGEFITYTLSISLYSVAMFAVCSLTLTVVFSLIFAYKTTQVKIVDYLKAE